MTLPEYPDTSEWSDERHGAHLIDAHAFEGTAHLRSERLPITHDNDHAAGNRFGIPHTHAEPKLTAEQAIAEIRSLWSSGQAQNDHQYAHEVGAILDRTVGT